MDMEKFFSYIREKYISTTLLYAIIVLLMGHPTLPLKATAPNDEWEQMFYQIISPLTLCVAEFIRSMIHPRLCLLLYVVTLHTKNTQEHP